jgi:hypothetical protein
VSTPVEEIDWKKVIQSSVWRTLPFTGDPKNPENEKGFRDAMIRETVSKICAESGNTIIVAFVCGDFALRTAANSRLSDRLNFASYESQEAFESFIDLTRENLTDEFVRAILNRASAKFNSRAPE